MKSKYLLRPILFSVFAFFALYTNVLVSHAQTGYLVGTMGAWSGGTIDSGSAPNGLCTMSGPGSATIAGQFSFYSNGGVTRTGGPSSSPFCPNYITINTSDRVQLICQNGSLGPILSGPGTFYPTSNGACGRLPSSHNSYAIFTLGGNWFSLNPAIPCTLQVDPGTATPGSAVNVTGTGFTSFNNRVQVTNTTDSSRTFSFSGLASPNTTHLSFTVPTDAYPGTYTITVPSNSSCTASTLQIKAASDAPSNLTATLDKTGIVKLNWIDNSQNETGFEIQRAVDQKLISFGPAGQTSTGVTAYSYKLDSTDLPGTQQGYRVRAILPDGTFTSYSNIASVKNCIALSGSGSNKVVFIRGKSVASDVDDFINASTNIVEEGFGGIEPFKSSIGKFSFYADITQFSDSAVHFANLSDIAPFVSQSACGGTAKDYIMFVDVPTNEIPGATSFPGYRLSVLNLSAEAIALENNPPQILVAMHEVGHSFAGLFDEYDDETGGITAQTGDLSAVQKYFGTPNYPKTAENCTPSPFKDYRSPLDNHIYGSVSDTGCTFKLSNTYNWTLPGQTTPSPVIYYYRPSGNSIMKDEHSGKQHNDEFNVISCGYILAAINGGDPLRLTPTDAAPYWPTCMNMAKQGSVTADNIPSVSSAPTLAKISDKTLAPDSQPVTNSISKLSSKTAPPNATITGTNFSMNPVNTIRLANALSSSVYYEIPNLASPDGKTLTFSLPDSIPLGKYNLQVGAFNSDWSKPIAVTVLAAGTPPPKNAPAPSPAIPPLYDFGGMYGGNSTNINPATGGLSCPSGYGSVLVYDSAKKGNAAYNLFICVRAHIAGQDPLYDFGGIFETASYLGAPQDLNVATGQMSCPDGFKAARVIGGNAFTDGDWNFCYSPYASGNHYYNFGGMYSSYANIVTGAKSCPAGYTALTLTALPATYCYQPLYTPSTPPVLKATALSGDQIRLTWTMASIQGVSSYAVNDLTTGTTRDSIPASTTSYMLSGLDPLRQYCYSIKPTAFYDIKESNRACATTLRASAVPVQTSIDKTTAITQTVPVPSDTTSVIIQTAPVTTTVTTTNVPVPAPVVTNPTPSTAPTVNAPVNAPAPVVTPPAIPLLNISGLSCTYSVSRVLTATNITFAFRGTPTGGTAPYAYTLYNAPPSGDTFTAGVSFTRTFSSVPRIYSPTGSYISVASKDGQKAMIPCVSNSSSYDWQASSTASSLDGFSAWLRSMFKW